MKSIAKLPRVSKAATALANPSGRKALVTKFAREFMVKPGQPTFDAVDELLRSRGQAK